MSAASGAASGAMQGFAIGGPYGALAGAAIGLFMGDKEEKQREELAKAQLEAAQKRNDAVLAETARGIGELNRTRTAAFIKTNQALFHYRRQGATETAELSNQYAALDVIGVSQLAAKSEIARTQDEAINQTMLNMEIEQENINTQVDTLTNSAKNQFTDASEAIEKIYEGTDTTSELFGLVQQGMGMYMGGQFNSGLTSAGFGNLTFKGGGSKIQNPGYTATPASRRQSTSSLLGLGESTFAGPSWSAN